MAGTLWSEADGILPPAASGNSLADLRRRVVDLEAQRDISLAAFEQAKKESTDPKFIQFLDGVIRLLNGATAIQLPLLFAGLGGWGLETFVTPESLLVYSGLEGLKAVAMATKGLAQLCLSNKTWTERLIGCVQHLAGGLISVLASDGGRLAYLKHSAEAVQRFFEAFTVASGTEVFSGLNALLNGKKEEAAEHFKAAGLCAFNAFIGVKAGVGGTPGSVRNQIGCAATALTTTMGAGQPVMQAIDTSAKLIGKLGSVCKRKRHRHRSRGSRNVSVLEEGLLAAEQSDAAKPWSLRRLLGCS